MQGNGGFFAESTTVDGSEIRRSPVEVGSFSHYLDGFMSFQTVVGWVFGISSSINSSNTSNTNNFIIRKIPSFQQPPPPPDGPYNLPTFLQAEAGEKTRSVAGDASWYCCRGGGSWKWGAGGWEGRSWNEGTLPDFLPSWWDVGSGTICWVVVFSIFFMFIPIFWANDPIWRAYFSKGLVQPPTRYVLETLLKKWAGNRLGEPGLDNWALPNRGSWLSGKWHYLKDNDPIGGTHFELPWLWGRAIDLFVVPLHDFLEMMWRRDWFQKQQS